MKRKRPTAADWDEEYPNLSSFRSHCRKNRRACVNQAQQQSFASTLPCQQSSLRVRWRGTRLVAYRRASAPNQSTHSIHVKFPFRLMGMVFVGPLNTTKAGSKYILNIVCYFSRFVIPFATKDANVESVFWCLKLLFAMYRKPYTFYCDRGQHFLDDVLRDSLGVGVSTSPTALQE